MVNKNILVVLCTHMFYIELIRAIDGKFFGRILFKLGIFEGIVFTLIVLAFESITIILCNRYFWFLFARKNPKRGYNA